MDDEEKQEMIDWFADEVAHKGYIGQQQLERFIEELEE